MNTVFGKRSTIFCASVVSMVLGVSLMAGCSSSSPGDEEVNVVQQQSYGQQLMDLDSARQKGLISDKEYKKARANILDKMNE